MVLTTQAVVTELLGYAPYAAALIGMVAHWAKRYFRKETALNLWDYMFSVEAGKTTFAAGTTLIAVWTMLTSGMMLPGVGPIAMSFLIGYGLNSTINTSNGPS